MSNIQSVVDHRGEFELGKTSTLFLRVTSFEGQPLNPTNLLVSVRNLDGEEIMSGVPEKIVDGFYIFDWIIDDSQDPGNYLAFWTYEYQGQEYSQIQQITVAQKGSLPSNSLYADRLSSMRVALTVHLGCAQAIPVYKEQGIIEADKRTVSFNFPRWNQNMGTRVFLNEQPVIEGAIFDYFKGKVIFDQTLTEYDTVTCDYNFRWFDDPDLDRFMQNALSIVNSYPPAGNYNLDRLPDRFIPHVLYGATKDAIRQLLMCLQFQEPKEVFGGPEAAQTAFQQLETLKQNYEKDFRDLLEQKKFGPYKGLTKAIVVPEYTLPGGRSRWFRYLFKSGSAI